MNESRLRALLAEVAGGTTKPEAALEVLRTLPFTEAAATMVDTHRAIRLGMPEVVYAKHKTTEQVSEALAALVKAHGHALATSVSTDAAAVLSSSFKDSSYDAISRLFRIGRMTAQEESGPVAVVCAGTSDISVAEEAAQTIEFAGHSVQRVYDVGVAGLHRLLSKLELLRQSRVIIAIAGMEGALPSVVGGLVAQPVIAVPTSVGYGANFGGLSALLAMLNSCSSGIGIVNIDNGFGAAMLALRILQGTKCRQN
jgi:NCAIR mutase (PurE)-related protein